MNKLNPIPVGMSLSAAVAVLYLLCALAVWIAPGVVAALLNMVVHGVNLAPLFQQAAEVNLLSLLGGTIALALYFFVAGWLFAWVYNRLIGP